jgi:cellulose synthase/poly-beta-1,6-N-acetylglucosamine synthase-like glycosyltransferase
MSISLIISVYKNIQDLNIVLEALKYQTYDDFEIVVSEDGEDTAMRAFILEYNWSHRKKVIHVTQADKGWRKNRALNQAIRRSTGDYLVFIDGDCLLHPKFIEHHVAFAREDRVLAGKRIKLGEAFSNKIRDGIYHPVALEKILWQRALEVKKDGARFIEEGFYIDPAGFLGFIPRMRIMKHLKGCNMSFHRETIERINGFDEDYVLPAVGEDADLAWRFSAVGYRLFSLRNIAVQYHLYHKENWTNQDTNLKMMKQKMQQNQFFCRNGLTKMKFSTYEHNMQDQFRDIASS